MKAPHTRLQPAVSSSPDGKTEQINKVTGSANQHAQAPTNKSQSLLDVPLRASVNNSAYVVATTSALATTNTVPTQWASTQGVSTQQTSSSGTNSPIIVSADKSFIPTNNIQPVVISTTQNNSTPSQNMNITIANQQYQFNLTAELQKIFQNSAQIVITADAAKEVNLQRIAVINTLIQTASLDGASKLASTSTSTSMLAPNHQVQTQLILLAQTIQIKLPTTLIALAVKNGVSTEQLSQLASRPQGYPLPNAIINQQQLSFVDGPTIKLDHAHLAKGQYLVNIMNVNQRLVLTLTPVQAEVKVSLTPITQTQDSTITTKQDSIVLSKPEPSQLLNLLFKKLETSLLTETALRNNQPTSGQASQSETVIKQALSADSLSIQSKSAAVTETIASSKIDILSAQKMAKDIAGAFSQNALNQNALNSGSTKTQSPLEINNPASSNTEKPTLGPIEVLQKALSKAGAMPVMTKTANQSPQNLALELLKLLPQLAPQPMTTLTEPNQLLGELHSITGLNLAQTAPPASQSQLFSGGAVSTLFQLLLGVKAQNSGKQISEKLQNHLQLLQRLTSGKSSANSGLLGLLEKAGTLDSMSQLANSFQLYQQASSSDQTINWYFALPYSLNQRNEQFEGHFQKEPDKDTEDKAGWRLQLKFNLSQGAILIIAHKKADVLNLQFMGNNQQLLDKISNFDSALSQKMSQIGFTPGEFSTQIANIPATLLPGDHFLVKTRA
ncbi:hypothetical protein [Shewanella glacialimarina]|uniref:hypothetical protein n=1 Tax=Shewanella glacialimarina TaxID=2590884 RepID=UPI001CF873D0|nr:hypothetical protein [Shewanella glacialimarina]UCX05295.1 hypothetical protein FJ709_12845 [Shewanella glacialimarina]